MVAVAVSTIQLQRSQNIFHQNKQSGGDDNQWSLTGIGREPPARDAELAR